MDSSHVAPAFQRYALFMKVAIIGCLALYSGYAMYQIMDRVDSPPVESRYAHWDNAGKFMVCAYAAPDGELRGVGLGLPHATASDHHWSHYAEWTQSEGQLSSLRVEVGLEAAGKKNNCSIVDLSAWSMPEPPLSFSICHDSLPGAMLFGWNGFRWLRLESQPHHSVLIFKFSKRQHGMDSGFTQSLQVIFRTALQSKWSNGGHNHSDYCQGRWKRFRPSSGGESAFVVSIEEPLIETTTKQGVLPQVIALVGNLGGYLALAGTLFTSVWVRRYPGSEVLPC